MLKHIIGFLRQGLQKVTFSWLLLAAVLWVIILVAVWWGGPLFTFHDVKPFASLLSRGLFALGWLWLACIVMLWRVWRNMHNARQEQRLQESRQKDPLQAFVDGQQRFLDGWAQALKALPGQGSVYGKPWYMMLGLPGSGKSSLLHRACPPNKLHARLHNELRSLKEGQKVDCWLGEGAVIVDPDGDLLLQTGGETENKDEQHSRLWRHLLSWLKVHRRRQPLNGLILTLDLGELARMGASARHASAQVLRTRLMDIADELHTRLPVYVVLTHIDMLHGAGDFFRQLDAQTRQSLLGVSFSPDTGETNSWSGELETFWDLWLSQLNTALSATMLEPPAQTPPADAFLFIRQLAGLKSFLQTMLSDVLAGEEMAGFPVRGIYLSSVYQQGVPFDGFSRATARRYRLAEAAYPAARGESSVWFVRQLFTDVVFPQAHLAGESRLHQLYRHRRMSIGTGLMVLTASLFSLGWYHYYQTNRDAGRQVLRSARQFIHARETVGQQAFGTALLPRLNLIREAALSYGDYRSKNLLFADMGLYQGGRIGPYVETSYLALLQQQFLPAVLAGLAKDLQQAPAASEEKMSVLRVMRMTEDASGRSIPLVEQYMAWRWQKAFPEQGLVQQQLMQHLDYALRHTDWHKARVQQDPDAIAAWKPFAQPVADAQQELSRLPLYQRVYQGLMVRATATLPPDLRVQDETGQSFDSVFVLRDAHAGTVPRLFTWSGYSDFFRGQNNTLFDLTGLDAWVLGQHAQVQLSEADRSEIQRQVSDRYISDYTGHWQKLLSALDIQPFDSPEQALSVLNTITGDEQPFRHIVSLLSDNTAVRPLTGKGEAPQRDTLSRIARPFTQLDDTLKGHGDSAPLIQGVNQQLIALAQWLEQINSAGDPGAAAFKALQLRQSDPYKDPAFSLQQYARGLPAPLDRWVSQIATQVADVTTSLAMSSLNQAWSEQVLTPFNDTLADRYPFNPTSSQDASLSEVTRFFAPGGTLDSFYQSSLKPLLDSGVLKQDAGNGHLQTLVSQLDQAQRIREALFNTQGQPEVHFVVEPVELTASKRRSVLNLDGQLVEYSHGRRQKVPLVWPNALRDGAESKLTLIPDDGARSPRSLGFTGPWAMFRLLDAGNRTQVSRGSFDVRFGVDDGAMTWRVYSDADHSPFATGLFSQFRLPETLY
ncbi:TPA: type VI secretion system membrane subunit TssM [Serratia marcescens]|uniref:Type VI secretion system membrane subunit TssM n=2 Tax=Serratia TaxID=613 RepID=A0A9X9G0B5_9GAMM|nr:MULTISPECIES: type VI secretion system membrane subunit TssM [Serratia]MBS3894580.1 type VI secretion system membrane subunit TssM [Serratia marcescens]TXE21948.1 type VI secretion system membrane subunit TssM [Serratia ureilytica]HBC7422203.1 type VI secretion system membrane subunit TssM [Serratia marcescens]